MKVAKGTRLKSSVSITTFWEKATIRRRQRSEIYAMCNSQITHSSGLGGQGLVREQLLMDAQVQDKWGVSSYREASKELLHCWYFHSEARQHVNNSKGKWKRNGQHIQHIFFRFFHTFLRSYICLGAVFRRTVDHNHNHGKSSTCNSCQAWKRANRVRKNYIG